MRFLVPVAIFQIADKISREWSRVNIDSDNAGPAWPTSPTPYGVAHLVTPIFQFAVSLYIFDFK